MEISDLERAAPASPEVMTARTGVSRPGIGITVNRRKLKKLRESALLERIDLSDLSKLTDLRQIAADSGIAGCDSMDYDTLLAALQHAGVPLPPHIGISRDAIAKILDGTTLADVRERAAKAGRGPGLPVVAYSI